MLKAATAVGLVLAAAILLSAQHGSFFSRVSLVSSLSVKPAPTSLLAERPVNDPKIAEICSRDPHCSGFKMASAKQGQLQQLAARSKATLTNYLLHKPRHHMFSTEPAGGHHLPARPKPPLPEYLMTKPRRHHFSAHVDGAHEQFDKEHSLTSKRSTPSKSGRWWQAKGQEASDISSAARWGLEHPAGQEMGASNLQHLTQREKPGDKAFWHKLGYKGRSLDKKLPHCELFHDCK